jgi:hypothetical protein
MAELILGKQTGRRARASAGTIRRLAFCDNEGLRDAGYGAPTQRDNFFSFSELPGMMAHR